VVRLNAVERLDNCHDFSDVFGLVKDGVEDSLGRRRVGLILALADLPIHVGAFHQLGSNFIVINRKLLNSVIKTNKRKLINAYVFHILLHEYIHSLGILDEQKTQLLSYEISKNYFGSDHLATQIAIYGIGPFLSHIIKMGYEDVKNNVIEIIEDFEVDNLNYFG
jgi:hypothetical protein